MSGFYCQEERELSCDSCYGITKEYCDPINIPAGVAPGYETLYLQIVDKFVKRRTQQVDINGDGSFDIDTDLLPDDYLNPYAGKFELYLSTDEDGENIFPMTFSDTDYNCVLLSIIKTINNTCCE